MAKFYGEIGYSTGQVETEPGVWSNNIVKRNYYGDVIKNIIKEQSGEYLNSNVILNNRISIIADPFAYENFHAMKYIKWMGSLWKIVNIEVQRPRLILTIGGVYNEH